MSEEIPPALSPTDRLPYAGTLGPVLERATAAFNIGHLVVFSTIDVGYEDCNMVINTDKGRFVAKMFAKTRTLDDINRYVSIIQHALASGVRHPALLSTPLGNAVYTDSPASTISMVMMPFIEGETFLDLDRAPNTDELYMILEQASRINATPYHPPFTYDSWAVPHIDAMLQRVAPFIPPADARLIEQVLTRYHQIPLQQLPHCLVHGDFTKANILRAKTGDIYVLDFAVANWYPRIQELSVIAANLMYDNKAHVPLSSVCERIAQEYGRFSPLQASEQRYLYPYALAAVAMEFMGSLQEKFLHGHATSETDYWLALGRDGLQRALSSRDR